MSEYVEMTLDDGTSLLVEVADDDGGLVNAARPREVVEAVAERLEDAIAKVGKLGRTTIATLRDSAASPSRVAIELGLKVSTKAGFVVAETSGEAQLKITLEWDDRTAPAARGAEDDSEPAE